MFRTAGWLFGIGILLFCGSLYFLVFFDLPWLGIITPFGGIVFIGGWVTLAISFWKGAETLVEQICLSL